LFLAKFFKGLETCISLLALPLFL